ncbi:hypothetical protein C5167_021225 [Papaver somniferum]|uniref:Uncharacterized protein n=1 Tax=Papaver somniferum TaxID=3469 RepID=A0A4Y7IZ76_PAPSO|nr:hypothetical protein C5167_021225 [Papaver somniferum]
MEARLPPPPTENELPPPPPMNQLPPPEEGVSNENLPLQLSPASSVTAPTESEGMRAAALGCD